VKYLMDTDHISVWQRGSGPDFTALETRLAAHPSSELGLSVVSFQEQVLGCHTYIGRARTMADVVQGYAMLSRLLDDYKEFAVLPFDVAAGAVLDGLKAQRVRIGTMDLRIASIALSRRLTLLTRNTNDFGQVPGLVTENWTV
jgi:tRNA(fMet)-specific endonuclease VapC